MKYYYTLSFEKLARLVFVVFTLVLCQANVGLSQCTLSCNGTTQVSLSADCNAIITPNMILSDNGASCPSPYLRVEVSDENGNLIPGINEVTSGFMGQTLTVSVIDNVLNDTNDPPLGSGNTCWGLILIEDKFGPSIMGGCTADLMNIELECADLAIYPGPTFTDNCDGDLEPLLLSEDITPCPSPDIIKTVTRTYTAVDEKGNRAANTCTVEIALRRFDINNVTFPVDIELQCDVASTFDTDWNGIDENEIPVSETGSPIYIFENPNGERDTTFLFPFPDVYCNTSVTFTDVILPRIGCTQKVLRNWVVRVWECPNSTITEADPFSFSQTINIIDNTPPVINTTTDGNCMINGVDKITVSTNSLITSPGSGDYGDFNCGVTTSLCLPSAIDNCLDLHGTSSGLTNCEGTKNPVGLKYDLTYDSGFIADYNGQDLLLPMGTSVVLFTVYDECYNSSQCHLPVEIIDDTPPIAICDQNTTVSLTSGGTAFVGASSFDDGSYDDCKDHCSLVRKMNPGTCECRRPDICDLDFLGERNGSYYYLSSYDISASIAKKRATAYGGHLVKFEDSEEEEWLTGEVRRTYSDRFWIGLKREGSGFRWDDHSSLSYTNWASGQPSNNAGEDCVMVTPGNTWNDASCDVELRYVLEVSSDCGFGSTINFCCSDADTDQMVVFRVVDFYGNFNDCMVNVSIQDKSAPVLNCPPNRTVACDFIYNQNDLNEAFGSLTTGESCNPNIEPSVTTNIRECGVGTIERLWTAFDSNGRELAHCKQTITFENTDPFQFDTETQCPESEITLNDCVDPATLTPASLGTPDFLRGQCDVVGTDFDDQLFSFNNTSGNAVCFKLIRTWEIIDWCQVNPNGTFRTWNCVQVIKVVDPSKPQARFSFAPDLDFDDKGTPVFSVFDCDGGQVSFDFSAEDACTPANDLQYSYTVTGPDGVSTAQVDGTGANGSISGQFAVGVNTAYLTYYDNCGNACTVHQEFIVANRKAATAYCLSGVAVDIMPISTTGGQVPDDAMIELWASDFDAGSSHPCGYPVHLSFTEDINNTNRTFTCNDIGLQEVRIYVTTIAPDGSLVQTFCTTFVDIQNNHAVNPCQQFTTVNVEGTISTETEQLIEDVQVTLEGGNTDVYTNTNGEYAFTAMGTGGDYIVNPANNTIPLNGVSTLDLVMIQRHILGVETLDSPYKIIAADINANNIIDGVDLVELRKLILGIYTEFPENESWRFVDKDYQFQNTEAPLEEDFSENYEIINLGQNMSIDFVAVKIGDVDGTVDQLLNGQTNSLYSTSQSSTINVDFIEQEIADNQVVALPFTIANSTSVTGFQFELDFDPLQVEVQSIQGVNIELNESNYNLQNGTLAISWSSNVPVLDAQFEVTFRTLGPVNLDELFSINQQSALNAEVYDASMNTHKLLMTPTTNITELVLQNNPNPFSTETELMFYLNEKSVTDIIISDVQGRVVKSMTQELASGLNTMTLNKTDLGNPGIYYLTVRTSTHNEMIKLVLLD